MSWLISGLGRGGEASDPELQSSSCMGDFVGLSIGEYVPFGSKPAGGLSGGQLDDSSLILQQPVNQSLHIPADWRGTA